MNTTRKITLSAVLLALGLILPFFTGQMQAIGNKLLPMHLPVLICGFVCGWKYGLLTGFITPLLRCVLFTMPAPINAICMAFELATYGTVSGFLYERFASLKCGSFQIGSYISLLGAMLSGRIVWGIVSVIIYGVNNASFTWQIFISGALLNAIPGIILQLILIPILILALEKAGVMNFETS